MDDTQPKPKGEKVFPEKPPEASISIPPKGKTDINSTSIPSSGTVTPSKEIISEMEKAVEDEIIPLPQEPKHPDQEQNE
ncbi:MAG TPA: hypothetical protein VMY36_03680 [Patescibacteria group bacterium]|nr:hypothetical protein [Patescibacteria group bacterium]